MNFNDMSGMKQWGLVLAIAGLLSATLYFTYFKSQRDANESAQKSLDAKLQENRELEPYKTKLAEIDRQLASLEQQMEIEKRIVPEEKEVDGFMKRRQSRVSSCAAIQRSRRPAKSSIPKCHLRSSWTALTAR